MVGHPHLNDLEHNLRKPPRGHLIEQFAKKLDIEPGKASEEQVVAAYRAFRKELKNKKL